MPEPHLDKLFRSTEELVEPEEAYINGNIPPWVNGTFVRVGPAKFDLPGGFQVNHWMDGYSLLSKFEISPDSVRFHKKFLQSDAYKRAQASGRPCVCEFGTKAYPDPLKNMFSRWISSILPIELTDNSQLNVFQLGKEVFAASETCYFRNFDLDQLSTGDKLDCNKFFGVNIATAHPVTDKNGATYNLGATVLTGLKYHIIKIPNSNINNNYKEQLKQSKIICTINSSWSTCMSYTHSIGMTKNYIVFVEQPYVMNVAKAFCSVLKGHSYKDWLEWRPELRNRFFLIDKETGKVVKTEYFGNKPFFFLHFINCYEEYDQVVIDIMAYSDPSMVDNMALPALRQRNRIHGDVAACHRYVIPLVDNLDVPEDVNLVEVKSDACAWRRGHQIWLEPEILSKTGLEFPTVNQKFVAKKYSYVYATGNCIAGRSTNSLCKVDLVNKESVLWRESQFYVPGEPIFIPNPNGGAEDDGVIVCAVSDERESSQDFLVFLDAKTMAEVGRATFKSHLPQAVHGIFIEREES